MTTPSDETPVNRDEPSSQPVCAIVVAFFPDQDLGQRLQDLLSQVGGLVIVDNTPGESSSHLPQIPSYGDTQVHVIENHANLGISVALNQGLAWAVNQGYRWILTLDQDTQCYPDMVDTLLRIVEASPSGTAVIGGNYFDPRKGCLAVPGDVAEEFLEQKTVITSGSLIDARLAQDIGGFREDYFIDQVDHEFCLRMRAHGHRVLISRKPVMAHSVGDGSGAKLPFFGTAFPGHPPVRKYYIARNTMVTVADYWRREPLWCLRRLVRLALGLGLMALLEEQQPRKIRAFAAGVADGLRRRLGPCSRESIIHARKN